MIAPSFEEACRAAGLPDLAADPWSAPEWLRYLYAYTDPGQVVHHLRTVAEHMETLDAAFLLGGMDAVRSLLVWAEAA